MDIYTDLMDQLNKATTEVAQLRAEVETWKTRANTARAETASMAAMCWKRDVDNLTAQVETVTAERDVARQAVVELAKSAAQAKSAAEDEIVKLQGHIVDFRATGEALVARWDTPQWKDVPHTAVFIDALRAALVRTPAQSLATYDVTVLRKIEEQFKVFSCCCGRRIRAMIEQIEAEAKGQ